MTTFIRKNDDDGSIDRSLLSRQFEAHLIGGRPHDLVALLELVADHDATSDSASGLDERTGGSITLDRSSRGPRPGGTRPSTSCVTLDGLTVWITTAMHVNGDAPSSPDSAALVTDATAAVLAIACEQLAEAFPDAWIGQACDVDGAIVHDELAVDHQEITFADYRNRLEWSPLLRIATAVGIAHNERLATVGA